MFDFGDELTIESYRIPWLVWIQILVMLLLVVLLFCFSLSALDLPDRTSSASASLCPESQLDKKPVFKQNTRLVSTCFQASQVGEIHSMKGEIATGASRRIGRGEDTVEKEGPSSKEANQNCYHPCHYLRLAKLAFLKCLGLDSTSESSSTSEQRNER
ncbi:Elicitor peptide - like 1 [Theobroma cacao]|nr:Elicitor peptide - like 1 [Theobroma cacao]